MGTTKITKLEMQVLQAAQEWVATEFESESGNWAYLHELDSIDARQLRALVTTLQSKGIVYLDYSDVDGAFIVINNDYFEETGNRSISNSPEIRLINLEVKA